MNAAPEPAAPRASGTKAELRRRLLAAREETTEAERDRAGSAIRDAVAVLPQLSMGGTVAAYYSVGTEPDTRKLVATLWKQGVYVLLPVFLPGGALDWAAYEGPDSLAPARFGLLEPTGPRYGTEAVARAAAVVCPALAVDRAGRRLGKGAGCYDRALSLVGPNTLTLGVIYDTEFLDEVPAEPHDRAVQGVVTPGGGVRML
ncbi:5-formyltetrahydrofolate cyclo-ligase [Nocardiopsis composta]|uniref:5-formyltetrahydrofolate cyclo-ligase n=1 Tax=Nocardiopsis composta TaxID=157465 RepID=A0A7W8QR97_9ACTN|nr:5-formyltetrahydrofolate cyclo-ligase [Nocardiopsis composta]MBB5434433.1 5-formyltetrahydrofolate cyclo-ligase [Nocardiopsis composta]